MGTNYTVQLWCELEFLPPAVCIQSHSRLNHCLPGVGEPVRVVPSVDISNSFLCELEKIAFPSIRDAPRLVFPLSLLHHVHFVRVPPFLPRRINFCTRKELQGWTRSVAFGRRKRISLFSPLAALRASSVRVSTAVVNKHSLSGVLQLPYNPHSLNHSKKTAWFIQTFGPFLYDNPSTLSGTMRIG